MSEAHTILDRNLSVLQNTSDTKAHTHAFQAIDEALTVLCRKLREADSKQAVHLAEQLELYQGDAIHRLTRPEDRTQLRTECQQAIAHLTRVRKL